MRTRMLALLTLAQLVTVVGCKKDVKPTDTCRIPVVVVVPWSNDSTIVEEDQYRANAKEISSAATLRMRDSLEKANQFDRVEVAAECPPGIQGFKVEGRLVSLIHKSRKFHGKASLRLTECLTGKVVTTADTSDDDKDISNIAESLGGSLARDALSKVSCFSAPAPAAPPPAPVPAPAAE